MVNVNSFVNDEADEFFQKMKKENRERLELACSRGIEETYRVFSEPGVRKTFTEFDEKAKSGNLTLDDINSMSAFSGALKNRIFAAANINDTVPYTAVEAVKTQERNQAAFSLADANKDGKLSAEEYKEFKAKESSLELSEIMAEVGRLSQKQALNPASLALKGPKIELGG